MYIVDTKGKKRQAVEKICEICKGVYLVELRFSQNSKYCNRACYAKSRGDKVDLTCAYCNKDFTRVASKLKNATHKIYFCSRACKDNAQKLGGMTQIQPAHYNTFTSEKRYREKALRTLGTHCNRCDYNVYAEMLDVHHIDGDRNNNQIENLEVLCVWCHALETRKIPNHKR